ncbi:MAG TPA: hypothetical protein PK406_14395, partial [Verrucomicrobiota bacterium]|nr:hypothetical protein [Verrucomicrobiota bacterium]
AVKRFGVGVLQCDENFEVHVRELLIKHGIARPLVKTLGSLLPRQSQTAALALRQGGGKPSDFGNLAPVSHARRVGRRL